VNTSKLVSASIGVKSRMRLARPAQLRERMYSRGGTIERSGYFEKSASAETNKAEITDGASLEPDFTLTFSLTSYDHE